MEKSHKIIINYAVIFLFASLSIGFVFVSLREETLMAICHEDGAVEWGQVVFLLLSSIASILFFVKNIKKYPSPWKYFSLVFGIFCFWVLLEEISYGQRIFHIHSPYYFERYNVHREINIHNLLYFDSATEKLSVALILVWGILLPIILYFNKSLRNFFKDRGILAPPIISSIGCIVGVALEFYCRYKWTQYWANSNEILEIYLYLSFFSAAVSPIWDDE